MFVGPISVAQYSALSILMGCSDVIMINMLLEMQFVKFLYTNVWCNIGYANDEFWLRFLWLGNVVHFVVLILSAPLAGYTQNTSSAISLGIPTNCLEHVLGETIYPQWLNSETYICLVTCIIFGLSWKSRCEEARLDRIFLARFGRNSRFGEQHVGVKQQWITKLAALVLGINLGVIHCLKNYGFLPEDFRRQPASTFMALEDITCWLMLLVIMPFVYIVEDKKTREGLWKALRNSVNTILGK